MDQTTDTADLTATEKYLNNVRDNEVSAESDSDREELTQDALLGGIRSGLNAITKTARKALSTCQNQKELDDEAKIIEESTLKLLKLEKSFMKTASIVSDVIDDLASDYEDNDAQSFPECNCDENKGAGGDASASTISNPVPKIFLLSESNLDSVTAFKEKLTQEFQTRLCSFQSTLTDSKLRKDKKFSALLDQIKHGREDAKISMKKAHKLKMESVEDVDKNSNDNSEQTSRHSTTVVEPVLSQIPFPVEELQKYQYQAYDEDNDMDHSILPTVDPITGKLIQYPLRNKYCNHVFDRDAVYNLIASNPDAVLVLL